MAHARLQFARAHAGRNPQPVDGVHLHGEPRFEQRAAATQVAEPQRLSGFEGAPELADELEPWLDPSIAEPPARVSGHGRLVRANGSEGGSVSVT